MITVYELVRDYYGTGKDEEFNVGEFNSIADLIKNFAKDGIKTTQPNISRALKKGYLVCDRFIVIKNIDNIIT